jgi:hypothetical protein
VLEGVTFVLVEVEEDTEELLEDEDDADVVEELLEDEDDADVEELIELLEDEGDADVVEECAVVPNTKSERVKGPEVVGGVAVNTKEGAGGEGDGVEKSNLNPSEVLEDAEETEEEEVEVDDGDVKSDNEGVEAESPEEEEEEVAIAEKTDALIKYRGENIDRLIL